MMNERRVITSDEDNDVRRSEYGERKPVLAGRGCFILLSAYPVPVTEKGS